MITILWIVLMIVGLLGVLFIMPLFVLGSPRADEPRFLKAMRYNIWAEYLALLGYGLLHPRLRAYRATRTEQEMPLPGDELVPTANAAATYAITIDAPPKRSGRGWSRWGMGERYSKGPFPSQAIGLLL